MKPIKLGMVGGGSGAFIGAVHRIASRIDGEFNLVAGALSSTPEKARTSGEELGLAPDRSYDSFVEMAKSEARLKDGIEAVAIVTPNHMHYPAAREFLERGIHVICDKPLTATVSDANKMATAVENSNALFILTHNYTGYPMIRQAKELVATGELGKLRIVQVEYAQDWLTEPTHNKQAEWRTDPSRSGAGGSTGDIGTHAYNLARFVSGLTLNKLSADLDAFVPGRRVDDNGHVLMRFEGGAKGMLWCSQVAPGNENGLRLRIFGEKGGLEWSQEDPNYLWYTPFGEAKRRLTRGGAGTSPSANALNRTPGGHPEGYLEAFANLYAEAAQAIRAVQAGQPVPSNVHFPDINDGVEGVRFIDACVRSSSKDAAWVSL
ncbi:Gfo/Idh/MocA family protein [Nereida ignava]|jgi:predicted dehydrogenase|uniref:Gfo/Idh/MocA family protein n=1 Tax=Nereida ignava TaxID=282199 RepID=UPI003F6CD1A7